MTALLEPGALGGPLAIDETLPQKAYRRLRGAITKGTLRPGARISESSLSKELAISRTALRESLVRLETEGYVRRNAGGRWRVTKLNRSGAAEIYECRSVLEGLAASLAAQRATPEELTAMARELKDARTRYEGHDVASAVDHSTSFHDLVVQAAHNRKLQILMNLLRPQLLENRLLMLEHGSRNRDFLDQNEQLHVAIGNGQAEIAAGIARQSAQDDLAAVLQLFDQGVLTPGDDGE